MARAGNLAAMDHDATAAGPLKAGNQPQQGGFARAGGAKQAEQLPRRHGQIQARHGPIRWLVAGVVAPGGAAPWVDVPNVFEADRRMRHGCWP